LAKGNDIRKSLDEYRRKVDESFGTVTLQSDVKERIITIVVLVIVLATVWFMLDLAIVTFIITFVFYHLHKYAMYGLSKTPLKVIPPIIVQVLVYAGVIYLVVVLIATNATLIVGQIGAFATTLSSFDMQKFMEGLDPLLVQLLNQIDINTYIAKAGEAILSGLGTLGNVLLNFVLGLFLSFIFVMEKHKIMKIANTIKQSRIAFLYRYFLLFFGSFCYAFGQVMKVQILIAACNCAIMTVYLVIAGFPYIIVLSIMIFLFSLVPVAGVIISAIPMVLIGLSIGGPMKALEVIIMIIVVNIIEAYTLEPKFMSDRTALPISLVFVILIVSQRYLGAWGMLIGIPIFIFVMNILNIDYSKGMEKDSPDDNDKPRRRFPFRKQNKT